MQCTHDMQRAVDTQALTLALSGFVLRLGQGEPFRVGYPDGGAGQHLAIEHRFRRSGPRVMMTLSIAYSLRGHEVGPGETDCGWSLDDAADLLQCAHPAAFDFCVETARIAENRNPALAAHLAASLEGRVPLRPGWPLLRVGARNAMFATPLGVSAEGISDDERQGELARCVAALFRTRAPDAVPAL